MLGIVAEGGASRTVYSAGVLDVLLENGINADYYLGVSAGIAFGASYCSKQHERNKKLIEDFYCTPEYFGKRHLLDPVNRSYYNLDYVFDKVPNELLYFDFEALRNNPARVLAGVTDLETGEPVYMDLDPDDRKFKILRASCALPLLFPPIELNGRLYVDGGISDSIPFERALADGCDKLIVIVTRERGYVKENEPTLPLLLAAYRKYPEFCKILESRAERYNEQCKKLEELRRAGKVFVFSPKKDKLVSRTENDKRKLMRLYEHGAKHAEWAMDSLRRYLESNA